MFFSVYSMWNGVVQTNLVIAAVRLRSCELQLVMYLIPKNISIYTHKKALRLMTEISLL